MRETEDLIRKKKTKKPKSKSKKLLNYASIIKDKLEKILKTSVKIKVNNDGKGSVNILFNSQKDLNEIIDRIDEYK